MASPFAGGILVPALLAAPVALVAQLPTRPLSPVTDRFVEELGEGLRHHHLEGRARGLDPWAAHMLEVDLRRHEVDIALAMDQIIGQEAPSSLVRRRGALAGVNGGFSVSNDPWSIVHGDPNGFVVVDGVVVSEPVASRPALGFCGESGDQEVRIVTPSLTVRLAPDLGAGRQIGLNRARGADDVVVYTPEWNATTLTGPGGVELVVVDDAVVSIESRGSVGIPSDGFVVSASAAATQALSAVRVGDALAVSMEVRDGSGSPMELSGCDFTSAGPVVARHGVVLGDHPPESYREGFVAERHPRTAVGLSADEGTLLLFVIDGRQPGHSVGATLDELGGLLLAEGAAMVYNLDGGGSSTMALPGRGVLNSPSDGKERRRCDVVLIQPVVGSSTRAEPGGAPNTDRH